MKAIKNFFIKDKKKKPDYHWEKEGKDILEKIKQKNYNKEELKKVLSILLLKDVPKDFVTDFWLTCSGARERMNQNKGQYQKLVKAFNILVKNKHPFYLHLEKKISIDLNRSFNQSKINVTPEIINKLRDILYAFAVRNVSINYCQGLNSIVAYILRMTNFKEEESFYLFLTLMENILPYDYYLFGLGVQAELQVINILLEKYEPDITSYLNTLNGTIILYSVITQFVTSLLIFKINQNISNILYNCFFGFILLEDKDEVFYFFYKIIIGIFKLLKKDILKCKAMSQLKDAINLEKEFDKKSINSIKEYVLFEEGKDKLDSNYVKQLRIDELNKIIKVNKCKFNFKNLDNIECNIYYPMCIEEWNIDSSPSSNATYEKINSINNENNIINNEEDDEQILKDIIIERRQHYCKNNK